MSSAGPRPKLGLALSGGGLRATLFHTGVLRRLAELGLLGRVEVISGVSGGSILAAVYFLLLKRRLDERAELERADLRGLAADLEGVVVRTARADLRTRLLLDPLENLRVISTPYTLAERMARIYERHVFSDLVEELRGAAVARDPGHDPGWREGRIPLTDLRVRPGGEPMRAGIEDHNARHETKVPKLILNATCLNTGRSWRFSAAEVGDPVLGFVRPDETDVLDAYRPLAEAPLDALAGEMASPPPAPDGLPFGGETVALAALLRLWEECPDRERWRFGSRLGRWRREESPEALDFSGWPFLDAVAGPGFPLRRLLGCEPGDLRAAKLEAWYLRRGLRRDVPVSCYQGREGGERRFWEAIRRMGGDVREALGRVASEVGAGRVMDRLLDLYYLRTAAAVAPGAGRALEAITLGDAVAASAAFPPVFPPFRITDLYRDAHAASVRLTDGGVFDNQGLGALLEEECTHLVVSDAGGRLATERRVVGGRVGMMGRVVSVLLDNVRRRQLAELRERARVADALAGMEDPPAALRERYRVREVAFFHMTSAPEDGDPEGLEPHPFPDLVAGLRTDLDLFGDGEIAALVYHGYDLADRFVRRYITEAPFASGEWEPALYAPLRRLPARAERRVLAAGAHRFLRALRVGAWDAWAFTLLVLAATVLLLWRVPVSPSEVAGRVGTFLATPLILVDPEVPGGALLLGALVAAAISVCVTLLVRRGAGRRARLAGAARALRARAGLLLWLFWLLPLWLALGAAAAAVVSHGVFARSFRRASEIPGLLRRRPEE